MALATTLGAANIDSLKFNELTAEMTFLRLTYLTGYPKIGHFWSYQLVQLHTTGSNRISLWEGVK